MVHNNLRDIHSDICSLPNLRILNCRHNKLKNDGVPPELFHLDDLSVVVSQVYVKINRLLMART